MKNKFSSTVLCLAVLLGCQGPVGKETPEAKPNVLILMVDALRADRLGVNGYARPTTPNIDLLAAEGINFKNAFAHSTWTKPSIATLFTSAYPSQHGLDQVARANEDGLGSEVLHASLMTMAERFRAGGYSTGAVINQVHITPRFGFDQGFDHFNSRRGTAAPRLNRQLLGWLTSVDTTTVPFFAYLHYLDVHWPYTKRFPERAAALGSVALTREPPKSGKGGIEEWTEQMRLPEDLAALEARYDHEVAFTDQAIGELVASLKELGLYENTVIVLTADHGEEFLEHGMLLHGHGPHEELIRVPLIVRLPDRYRGEARVSDSPVGLVDLMPTLVAFAGLGEDPGVQGRSLMPLIRGQGLPDRLVFVETSSALAVRSRNHKLIRFADGQEAFYDLTSDPLEKQSLSGDCGEPCDQLARRLGAFSVAMAASRQTLQTEVVPLEQQDLEDMRALGYLD